MITVCKKESCTGCMACCDICPKSAISVVDNITNMVANIDENKCIKCELCKRVCQVNNPIECRAQISYGQGWANGISRKKGSSGGIATELLKSFINEKSYVVSCIFEKGKFVYHVTNDPKDLDRFTGSKYVKSNPKGNYKKVKELLENGNRVLFIGLPCHVAALKKYIGDKHDKYLYTVDLICHGSPSSKILESFVKENGKEITFLSRIQFREKNVFGLKINDDYCAPKGCRDRYTIGFLHGLFYTENCYSCPYAKLERVGDLTIGDSWGTQITEEKEKGISLILCQSNKGSELLDKCKIIMKEVNINKAVEANGQLDHPSAKSKMREVFFLTYDRSNSVKRGVFRSFPKECIKQDIKGILQKCGLKIGT